MQLFKLCPTGELTSRHNTWPICLFFLCLIYCCDFRLSLSSPVLLSLSSSWTAVDWSGQTRSPPSVRVTRNSSQSCGIKNGNQRINVTQKYCRKWQNAGLHYIYLVLFIHLFNNHYCVLNLISWRLPSQAQLCCPYQSLSRHQTCKSHVSWLRSAGMASTQQVMTPDIHQ